MIESLVLGAIQGVAEWLPISSEAMIILVKNNLFNGGGMSLNEQIHYVILLHLGTLLAAVVYFWPQVRELLYSVFSYDKQEKEQQQYLWFIFIATVVSGLLGFGLFKLIERYETLFSNETAINLGVSLFLLVTALLLWYTERSSHREGKKVITNKNAVITGLFQGIAAIPGISRSGSTIAGMALLGFNKVKAVETSFILSIPFVLAANIFLNYNMFSLITLNDILGVLTAFVFGYLTISFLLALVKKIRFSYFVGFFAILLLTFTLLV